MRMITRKRNNNHRHFPTKSLKDDEMEKWITIFEVSFVFLCGFGLIFMIPPLIAIAWIVDFIRSYSDKKKFENKKRGLEI